MKRAFADIATTIDQLSGRPLSFAIALLIIATWALSGTLFNFSDTWQLIINTSTTIITFLMVFVIQNTQNRDGAAIQAELDQLIRVSAARNSLIGIETLTQDEIEEIRATCAAKARRLGPIFLAPWARFSDADAGDLVIRLRLNGASSKSICDGS
ncbi:MAG: low affinity iron permease family protein [Xanthobacteraceae bacterium]